MRQRLDVESAAADNDRQFSARMNLADRLQREVPKFFRIHLFQDRHRADEMMRNFRERRSVRLRGQQIQSAINLERVRADNFCAELVRDISRDLGFAGRRRTDDEKNVFQDQKKTPNAQRRTPNIQRSTLNSTFSVWRSALGVFSIIEKKTASCAFANTRGLKYNRTLLFARMLAIARFRAANHQFAAEEFFF